MSISMRMSIKTVAFGDRFSVSVSYICIHTTFSYFPPIPILILMLYTHTYPAMLYWRGIIY